MSINGNAIWLRERVAAIRNGDKPKNKGDWNAFCKGLEMIADWEKTQNMFLNIMASGDKQ